jgi:DNA-binding CsgD family transcriptional regulator
MTAKGIVRVGGDWTSLIEAMQRPGSSETAWADDIVLAAESVLTNVTDISLVVVEHSADCRSARTVTASSTRGFGEIFQVSDDSLARLGRSGFRRYFYPAHPVSTHLEIERGLPAAETMLPRAYRRELGVVDALGILAHPEPGTVVVLGAALGSAQTLTRRERGLLTRVGLHLETSYRLRHRPEIVKAELDADGHRTAPSEPVDLWPLVRLAAVLTRDPRGRFAEASLTAAESDVLELLQRGLSNDAIAKLRSRSVRTIANQVASLLRKTHSPSRRALIVRPREPS